MLITKQKFYLILSVIITFMLLFSIEVQAQIILPDINGNWAQKPIQALVDKGIIDGYPDGTFKPDQPITRAEFSKLVAKAFKYQPANQGYFSDTADHWAKPYINEVASQKVMNAFSDGTFRPQDQLNRSQMATFLTRIVNLGKPEEKYEPWSTSFSDVTADNWAFQNIEIVNKLGVFPNDYKTQFYPGRIVTRAEAAWMVEALSNLTITKGKITSVSPDSGLVNVKNQNNDEPTLVMATPDTIILRNNASSDIDSLLNGDDATIIASSSGDVKFLKTFGQVTKNDLLSRLSSLTKGNLTKDEVAAMVAGDWNTIKDDLKGDLYNKMIDMGLSPDAAEGIMAQDWNYLDTVSRDNLAQALSSRLGITQDFAQALLARDVEKIKEYGKIELATAALSKLLGVADNNSNLNNNSY